MFTAEERRARGLIAIKTRWGHDPTDAKLHLAELTATRELREAAGRLVAARQGQGFPDRVEDSSTLARIATLIAEPVANSLARAITPSEAVASSRVREVEGARDTVVTP